MYCEVDYAETIFIIRRQIQQLLYIRDSHSSLSKYHSKLVQNYHYIQSQHNRNYGQFSARDTLEAGEIKGLSEEHQKSARGLREMETKKNKAILTHQNLLTALQASEGKFDLEVRENSALVERKEDLSSVRNQLVAAIKGEEECLGLVRKEVTKRKEKQEGMEEQMGKVKKENQKRKELIEDKEEDIEDVEEDINKCNSKSIKLDKQIQCLERDIEKKQKENKELVREIIDKKEEYMTIRHRYDYEKQLLVEEEGVYKGLQEGIEHFNKIIQREEVENKGVKQENKELQRLIIEGREEMNRKIKQKNDAIKHLQSVEQMSKNILFEMKKVCVQDKKVHNLLQSKVERLLFHQNNYYKVNPLKAFDLNEKKQCMQRMQKENFNKMGSTTESFFKQSNESFKNHQRIMNRND